MTSTLFIAGLVLSGTFIFIYLFILLHRRSKQKALVKQQATFNELIVANNLVVDEKEIFERYLIALDEGNQKFIFINLHDDYRDRKVISLSQLKSVRIITDENSVCEDKKGKSVLIEKQVSSLHLELAYSNVIERKLLTFFKYGDALSEYNYVKQRADYWKDRLNAFIKKQ